MIGLLYKDILYIKKMWKTMLSFGIFFALFGFNKIYNASYITCFMLAIACNFSMQPFHLDTYSKWKDYQYAFPISRKTVVCSRYLFGMILFCACILLDVLGIIINRIVTGESIEKEFILAQLIVICIIPLLQSISFPLMYRFGIEQGRIYFIGIIAVIGFLIISSASVLVNIFGGKNVAMITLIVALISLLFYISSLFLSIKIEQKNSIA